jgi:hypothetical protein
LQNELTQLQNERDKVVEAVFPQLAYLLSNIVILLDRHPPHHSSYIEKLQRFAEASSRTPGFGEKPFLIVVQNFVDPPNPQDTNAYKLAQSTNDFLECIKQSKAISLLEQYRDLCFIRLPSWHNYPLLYDQQICLLRVRD